MSESDLTITCQILSSVTPASYSHNVKRLVNNGQMENKREAFRKYLDDGGVLDSLTRVLVALYEEPENPEDALEYIKQFLGSPQGVDVESLEKENEELTQKVAELKARLAELQGEQQQEEEAA